MVKERFSGSRLDVSVAGRELLGDAFTGFTQIMVFKYLNVYLMIREV